MNDADQELFQFLLNVVPRHISDVTNSMSHELIDIRKNLIRKARIITEFRYFLKRYLLSDSKTEKKIRKFEADYFNSPSFNLSTPTSSKQKSMRKSISIDQDFLNTLLNNEEIINVASPKLNKKSKSSYKKENLSDSECFEIDTETNFVSYLFIPKETSPFLGLSLISQNSSVIINFIHDDPTIFIDALLKNQDHPNFVHITQNIIPSIFGYFSTSEHLDYATEFYIKFLVNENTTPEIAIPILAPFFNSPASYRFTEKVYTDFFQKVAEGKKDDVSNKPDKNSMTTLSHSIELNKQSEIDSSADPRVLNSRLLNSCILNAVPLLPPHFFKIFKQMRVRRWTLKDWYNLFFREFILISMNQWIRASFCDEYVEILFNIMSRKFITRRELAILFKNILKSKSIYEPPQLFKCFKSPSTLYLLSIRNLQILVSFLCENQILPKSVDSKSFEKVLPKYRYASFWCNVFSRKDQEASSFLQEVKESTNNRLVFQSFNSIRAKIENEDANSNLDRFKKEFSALQNLAEKYEQTNKIEFVLQNSGRGEFHQYAKRKFLSDLIKLADDFEETMEMFRLKNSINEWEKLLQSNENMLVLSHLHMFEKRMDVVQSMPTFIKQALFLNKIDESKFYRFSDSYVEIGKDWDLIVHSPHFTTLKFSNSLFYAPSPTINKSNKNQEQKSKKSNFISRSHTETPKVEKNKKMINSASSPNLGSLGDDDDNEEELDISESSSDSEDSLFDQKAQQSDRNNLNIRRLSINISSSDYNVNSKNSICRSMSSESLFNQSNIKLEPFSPINNLPKSFFDTLDLVSLIDHVRLPEKFLITMKVLEQIEFFCNQYKSDFSFLIVLLQNIPGQILIPMYIILNVFAMREPNIFLLCSELERKRWLNFEQIVLKCASENLSFLSKLLNLQNAIQDEFNQWKNKNFKNW